MIDVKSLQFFGYHMPFFMSMEYRRDRSLAAAVNNAIFTADRRRTCRVCGCSEYDPCEEGCYWVDADLCSSCEGEPAAPRFRLRIRLTGGKMARKGPPKNR